MDIWQIDKLILFLIFFVPGFISIKVYSLLFAHEKRDFSKDLLEAIGYSALNFAALCWLIIPIHSSDFYMHHKVWYVVFLFVILFIAPMSWPFIFSKIITWKPVKKHTVHPIKKPWDYVFSKKESYWVIVHLKDGRRIGGRFDTDSFASSYPSEEQIYLEEVWELDDNGGFVGAIDRSKGVIVLGQNIMAVELFGQ